MAGAIGVVKLGDLHTEDVTNEISGQDRVRRAVGHDATIVKHRDAWGGSRRQPEVVQHGDHGDPALAAEPSNGLEQRDLMRDMLA